MESPRHPPTPVSPPQGQHPGIWGHPYPTVGGTPPGLGGRSCVVRRSHRCGAGSRAGSTLGQQDGPEPGAQAPRLQQYPCQGLSSRAQHPWEPIGPKARPTPRKFKGGACEHGRFTRVGRLCQAAELPGSSLPLPSAWASPFVLWVGPPAYCPKAALRSAGAHSIDPFLSGQSHLGLGLREVGGSQSGTLTQP